MKKKILILFITILFTTEVDRSLAELLHDEWKVVASDSSSKDEFGQSVAVSGGLAVVGAPKADDGNKADAGAAYVYIKSGREWKFDAKLTATDGEAEGYFGNAVAVSGKYVFVGAWGVDGGINSTMYGAVYVFKEGARGWKIVQKLQPTSTNIGGKFGKAIAVFEDYLVVGAPMENHINGVNAGAVYVYRLDTGQVRWDLRNKFFAPDPGTYDNFGWSVDIDSQRITAGAPYKKYSGPGPGGPRTGKAYVFQYNSNGQVQLESSVFGQTDEERLGVDVSIDGSAWVVGAQFRLHGTSRGVAEVYTYDAAGWSLQTTLSGPPNVVGIFGCAVKVIKGKIFVGDLSGNGQSHSTGVVFAYEYDVNSGSWNLNTAVSSSDGERDDRYGESLAADGNTLLIGVSYDTDRVSQAGSAYFYSY